MNVTESVVSLVVVGIGTPIYGAIAMNKDVKVTESDYLSLAFLLAGVPTGVFVFWQAIMDGMKRDGSSPLYAGILGICLASYTALKCVERFRALLKSTKAD